MDRQQGGVGVDLLLGAIAGGAATWLMGKVTTRLYEHEDPAARAREDAARGDKTAYGIAAEKAAGAFGVELDDEQRSTAGSSLHWGLGAGTGAVYAALRRRHPAVTLGHGTLFGTVFWLLMDETATAALGLTPGPSHFPWQTHARGLAGHLVFGLATETVLDLADRAR